MEYYFGMEKVAIQGTESVIIYKTERDLLLTAYGLYKVTYKISIYAKMYDLE